VIGLKCEDISVSKNETIYPPTPWSDQTWAIMLEGRPVWTELVRHSWKGKKQADGSYAKGSLSWGWDFRDNFEDSTIRLLEKGPQAIGGYEFCLNGGLLICKQTGRFKAYSDDCDATEELRRNGQRGHDGSS
jgi:hypothetical protein